MASRRSARLSTASVAATTGNPAADSSKRQAADTHTSNTAKKRKAKPKATPAATNGTDNSDDVNASAEQPTSKNAQVNRRAKGKDAVTLPTTPSKSRTAILHDAAVVGTEPLTPSRRAPRPADPRVSNALLKTPRGSRVAAYGAETSVETSAPKGSKSTNSKKPTTTATAKNETAPQQHLPRPTTTTANLLSDACAHLIKVDPKLAPLIAAHHCAALSPSGLQEVIDPFVSLASGIMAQQVSGAAASSIKRKFISLFNTAPATDDSSSSNMPPDPFDPSDPSNNRTTFPTPAQVAATPIHTLRTAGLSQRKAEYIHGLAQQFVSGELSAAMLASASDEEVMAKLIAVRGLGRWSVEMFEFFSLKRMDVFSTGDLGVQRGMAAHAGRDVAKLKARSGAGKDKWKYMSEREMLEMAEPFRPYRSLFMWYMWRVEDVDVGAIAGE